MKHALSALALTVIAGPALAAGHGMGDADAGEKLFNRQCVACHVVRTDDGDTLAGRNARTGPNLYNVIGREAGDAEDFRYSSALEDAGEAGLVWDQESLAAFIQDPTGYLREYLGDNGARSKMSYKVRKEEDAVNLAAYFATVSPDAEMEEAEASN